MSADPWTGTDPRPGYFDASTPTWLGSIPGTSTTTPVTVTRARPVVLVGVEGEHARRLERISEARGERAADVVAELLRDANTHC